MQQRILNMLNQIKGKWLALAMGTRIRLVVAALVFVAALVATIVILNRPDMVVIDNNMDAQTLSEAKQVLEDNGIKAQIANNTTALSVPKESVDQARLLLASNNITTSGLTYTDALDMTGAGTTEKTRMQMMILAKQTEIEESIKQLYNVKSASVILSMPDENTFLLRDQDTPSASVVIGTNGEMTHSQAEALATHISKSVHNLKLENISIVDTQNRPLYQPGPDSTAGYSQRQEMEIARKLQIEEAVNQMLSPSYDIVDTTASLAWDWTGKSTKQTAYIPFNSETGAGLVTEESVQESTVENSDAPQEPGVQSNNGQQQYPAGSSGNSSAESSAADRKYVYDIIESTESNPSSGQMIAADSSLAVRVYVNRTYNEDRLKENGELEDTTWQDFQTNLKLNPETFQVPEETLELIRRTSNIENVAVEGFVRPIFEDSQVVTRPINQLLVAGLLLLLIGLLAFGLIRRTQPVEITEIEPELSVEELLVSSSPEEEAGGLDAAKLGGLGEESVAEIDYFEESEVKKQIDKFIDEKPEAAAQLLRNWLTEEWE